MEKVILNTADGLSATVELPAHLQKAMFVERSCLSQWEGAMTEISADNVPKPFKENPDVRIYEWQGERSSKGLRMFHEMIEEEA